MAQLQFASGDTIKWTEGYGGSQTDVTKSSNETAGNASSACTGTINTKTLTLVDASTFANGDILAIHQTTSTGANQWQLNKIVSGATTTTLTLKYDLVYAYVSGAQVATFLLAKNLTINAGVTITVPTFNGSNLGIYPVMVNGIFDPKGVIEGSGLNGSANYPAGAGAVGRGGSGGDGGAGVATNTGYFGLAGTGPSPGGQAYYRTSSGAMGCSGGGGGGNGAAGTNGGKHGTSPDGNAGAGGGITGNDALTLLPLGSGGSGAAVSDGNPKNAGGGGGGGCIVIIIAKEIAEITGNIYLDGGDGALGWADTNDAHGGGGSGGSCLIKCLKGNIGANKITALAGAGGGTGGGAGGAGRIHVDSLVAITGTTIPEATETIDPTLAIGGPRIVNFL